jgi:hypothetical protein
MATFCASCSLTPEPGVCPTRVAAASYVSPQCAANATTTQSFRDRDTTMLAEGARTVPVKDCADRVDRAGSLNGYSKFTVKVRMSGTGPWVQTQMHPLEGAWWLRQLAYLMLQWWT